MERRLRLRAEADFARVRSQGRSQGNRLLTLLTVPNGLEHNRYGVVVSKRVGKAVTRNLVKRRLREVLRELDRTGCIALGLDLALIVRPAAAAATFAELRDAVLGLLRRAAIWRPGEVKAASVAGHAPGSVGTDQP
jgi:ribonuclease P protein component